MKIATVDHASCDLLSVWRSAILDSAASHFADPWQRAPQKTKASDMWNRVSGLPYPTRSDIAILPNGSMVFDAKINNVALHFSIWMTFGEVRIGVKIPPALILDNKMKEKISRAFDGKICAREEDSGPHIIFDWIFREGFASHDHMMLAVTDVIAAAVIAQRIAETLTHIYLSVLSFIVGTNSINDGEYASFSVTPSPQVMRVRKRIFIRGDIDAFRVFLARRGGIQIGNVINDNEDFGDGGISAIDIEMDIDSPDLSPGPYRDMDGYEFRILMSPRVDDVGQGVALARID